MPRLSSCPPVVGHGRTLTRARSRAHFGDDRNSVPGERFMLGRGGRERDQEGFRRPLLLTGAALRWRWRWCRRATEAKKQGQKASRSARTSS